MKQLFLIFLCSAIFGSYNLVAQKFLKQNGMKRPLTFNEMQLQFEQWKKITDIKKEKGWKYYARWANEMKLHTDAKGIPVQSKTLSSEIIGNYRKNAQNSAAKVFTAGWYPYGANAVPNNETGYMENGIGRINCITYDPVDPSTYYIGVAQGGVWKTVNNGASWIPLTDNLPILRVSDIAIDPNNTNTLYIAMGDFEYIGFGLNINGSKRNTHYGLGVYKTTDGGLSWSPTGLSFQMTQGDESLLRKIIVNSLNSSKVVACGVNGMYVSNDAGTTWTKTMDSLFWDMQQDPVQPNVLYAATGWVNNSQDGYAAIYKSTDFGSTWTMLNTGIPGTGQVQRVKLAIAPSDNNCIYALTVDLMSGLDGIYQSTDAGNTWQYIYPGVNILEYNQGSGTGGQGNYDVGFCVDKDDKNKVYAGGINMWMSVDGCQSFNPVSHWTTSYGPTIHADIHMISQQSSTGNVFVCCDGGLYRTTNVIASTWSDASGGVPWPTQWSNLSNGMQTSSFYRVSSSRNGFETVVAGAQDNGSFYFDGTNWNTIYGGDGMDNYIDPNSNNTLIASSQYGNFGLSFDGGQTFNSISLPGSSCEWTTPIIADYTSPGILYAGCEDVYQTGDNGVSWSQISNFMGNGNSGVTTEISALAVSYNNPAVILAAKRVRYEYNAPGAVYVTTDGGANWLDITAGLPDSLYFTSVEIDPNNSNTFYITMAGFQSGSKVYKTVDGGDNWQNISYNLPNLPVNCIKQIPGTGDMMIATDVGVYVLPAGTTVWNQESTNLPNVIVSDIEFNEVLNTVYIATFGRGIWAADLSGFTSLKNNTVLKAGQFELYPSPNDGKFTVKIPGDYKGNKPLSLEIIDVCGKVVYKQDRLSNKSNYIDLKLVPGLYHARIKGENISAVKPFVIQ